MTTYNLTMPLPPNIANGRKHWRARLRERQQYEDHAFVWLAANKHRAPRKPLRRATIYATLYTYSTMDTDNLIARLKWPVDYLVKAGWLVDDDPAHLEWTMPRQAIDRKRPRVEITLEG